MQVLIAAGACGTKISDGFILEVLAGSAHAAMFLKVW
jgi:hypothetical protein